MADVYGFGSFDREYDERLSAADVQDLTERLRNKMIYEGLNEEDLFPDEYGDVDLSKFGIE